MQKGKTQKKRTGNKKGNKSNKSVKKVVTRELVKRGLNRPEMKHIVYHALGDIASALSSSGAILDPTRQGDNNYILNGYVYPSTSIVGGAVVGNRITANGIHLKWRFFNDTDSTHLCRMMIVCDMDPTNTTVLCPYNASNLGTNGNILLLNDISSPLAPSVNRRYKMLYDRQFVLSGDEDNRNTIYGSKYIKLHNASVRYTLSASDTEALVANNRRYFMFLVADDTTSIAASITADFTFRDV